MYRKPLLFSLVAGTCLLIGCSAAPKVAQEKTVEVGQQTLRFGGVYKVNDKELVLTINDDPVMKGKFPPYTPTQNLTAQYNGLQVTGKCYFGSVLADNRGTLGIVASAIQSAKQKSSDKCEMFVNGKSMENLYF